MATTDTFWDVLTSTKSLIIMGTGIGLATLGAASRVGAESIPGIEIATEEATSLFGLLSGIGGALAQIISGKRLGDAASDRISIGSLLFPAAISIAGTAGSALLIPA